MAFCFKTCTFALFVAIILFFIEISFFHLSPVRFQDFEMYLESNFKLPIVRFCLVIWGQLNSLSADWTFLTYMLVFSLTCDTKVAGLRQRFYHSVAPGGLAGDRRGVVPASGFSFSAHEIWKVIKENKDLDLPAHKVTSWISFLWWILLTIYCAVIGSDNDPFVYRSWWLLYVVKKLQMKSIQVLLQTRYLFFILFSLEMYLNLVNVLCIRTS